jgi:hypothetical protein
MEEGGGGGAGGGAGGATAGSIGASSPLESMLSRPASPSPSGGADRRTGAEDGPSPTERRTAFENVVTPTVCDGLLPREPPEPGLCS